MFSIQEIIGAVMGLPQTQKDIRAIAQATPAAQAQMEQATSAVQTYATLDLTLKAIGVAALVWIAIRRK